MKKAVLIIVIVIIVGLLIFAGYFIYKNTSFLRFSSNEKMVMENNQNIIEDVAEQDIDMVKLENKTLQVEDKYSTGVFGQKRRLNLPKNFEANVYIAGLENPRFFDIDDQDNLIVADKGLGAILLIKDEDRDGVADQEVIIDRDLRVIHSVDYFQGDLYAAEEHQILKYNNLKSDGSYENKEVIISGLPDDGGHSTRTVMIGIDGKIYVSIGSSCNVCEEDDSRRAAIMRYNLDGSGEEIYSSGLRNSVGIEFWKGQLWSVDNGRDLIGDDLPPEEVNIVKQGQNYGWPYCYGRGIANPEYPDKSEFCQKETEFPTYKMQAHSASLGIGFLPASNKIFPNSLKNNIFIGFHGSWNRTTPTGYKVVRIDTDRKGAAALNFVTGWLDEDGNS